MTDHPEINNQPIESEEPKPQSIFGVIVHSFFIIPFLIAVFCIILFAAISLLTREQRTAYDYLSDIKTGGQTKRWQAAFELSKVLINTDEVHQEDRFVNELIAVYADAKDDDVRIRQYLALAMGRSGDPRFFPSLIGSLEGASEDNLYTIIYSLGMLRDTRATPGLIEFVDHSNPRIRSVTVVALGNIGDVSVKKTLKKALNDPEPNVQWGSAISLAHMGDAAGKGIIERLLSREYLSKFPEVDQHEQNHLILAALEAAEFIREPDFEVIVKGLADSDQNMKVRSAAQDYLKK